PQLAPHRHGGPGVVLCNYGGYAPAVPGAGADLPRAVAGGPAGHHPGAYSGLTVPPPLCGGQKVSMIPAAGAQTRRLLHVVRKRPLPLPLLPFNDTINCILWGNGGNGNGGLSADGVLPGGDHVTDDGGGFCPG